ncbi:cytochrome c class III [Pseudodesulfovibrio sp. JC047]|uniref:sulfate respiration complex hexadecaheme cytochrome HmcA n=1 Tax=Pseudodesulfovibrio sp. JC047 TaxID=2683199 RepID=UPI0013CFE3C7|nr:cytochrome c3 family protein [Pseudodesulfovibrio sp. JC047]NDV18695.1 cytochrome c class III [Pseudodesulfovibrio sp. JC047]
MANGKRMLRFAAIMIALVGVLGFQMEAMGMFDSVEKATGRPDVIMIDTIAKLESLEQSAVVFQHDLHTDALKEQGMSCSSCHMKDEEGTMSLTFNRLEGEGLPELSVSQLKDTYHDGCLSCHVESGDKGFKTGPMVGECRSCHQAKPEVTAERVASGMDNTLHFLHWDSKVIPVDSGEQTNCGSCHAVYDETAGKSVYKKGEEDSWRFASAYPPEELADLTTREVFHAQCVTCHQTLIEEKAERSGPVDCASCHDAKTVEARTVENAKTIEAMGGVPRLPRKQPDAVLMMAKVSGPKPEKATGMDPVAFDHKLHESAVETCRSCHDKGVNAPMDTSFKAFHDVNSDTSCVGCHAKEQKKPECAGCHAARPVSKATSDATCQSCHNAPRPAPEATEAEVQTEAMTVLASRPTSQAMVAVKDIPETVTIGALSNEYEPSEMPHRKIVLSLLDGMKDNSLATTFHATPAAMCAGCHHNAPATVTPPTCGSCHAKPFATDGMPGLKAAYHAQCMSCHTEMKLDKPAATNCVACHEKKSN